MSVVTLEKDLTAFVKQRLARSRSTRFFQLLPVFEQGLAGSTAHANGKLIVAEAKVMLEATPGLQGQRAQSDGKCATHAEFGIGERVHDARVAQGLAAARRGHVDDERTLCGAAIPHAGREVCCLVLPLEVGFGVALLQPFVVA